MSFSVPKTELIHWRTARQRGPISLLPVEIAGTLIRPSPIVRWLGFWFTPTMDTAPHFQKRLAQAQKAFGLVRQLSPAGKGLNPHNNRHLAMGMILPILTYGAKLFVPTSFSLDRLTTFWNKVLRWVTNTLSSTNISVLSCEACLPPLFSLLPHLRLSAALRVCSALPERNSVAALLPPSFPSPSPARAPSNRHLLARLPGTYKPLEWDSTKPPRGKTLLPLDYFYSLLPKAITLPPRMPLQNPRRGDPPLVQGTPDYKTLRGLLRDHTLHSWRLLAPPPLTYTYPPSWKPHLFMKLNRFTAGRLHQMRSGKSYLASQRSWFNRLPDDTPLCSYCEEEDEDFPHAILRCQAKADQRALHIPGVDSVDADSPIWTSKQDLLLLAAYITSTKTGYPQAMLHAACQPPSSQSSQSTAGSPSTAPSPIWPPSGGPG